MFEFTEIGINSSLFENFDVLGVRAAVLMPQLELIGGDDRDLMVVEIDHFLGVTNERTGIAGEVVLTLADADDKRTSQTSGHQQAGYVTEEDRQAVGPFDLLDRFFDRLNAGLGECRVGPEFRFFFELMGDQMGRDFGVGGRSKHVAELGQFVSQ